MAKNQNKIKQLKSCEMLLKDITNIDSNIYVKKNAFINAKQAMLAYPGISELIRMSAATLKKHDLNAVAILATLNRFINEEVQYDTQDTTLIKLKTLITEALNDLGN